VCAVKPPDGSFPQRILYEVLPPGDPRGDPGERQGGPPSVQVPEAKSVKNRVHLDIAPDFGTLVEEVERIVALGATVVVDRRRPDGTGWFVLSDPEGNEFCESGPAERAAARAAAQA
jgi:hypothetical protein